MNFAKPGCWLWIVLILTSTLSLIIAQTQENSVTSILCSILFRGSCQVSCEKGPVPQIHNFSYCSTPLLCCPPAEITKTDLWGPWQPWSSCTGRCGPQASSQYRTRECQTADSPCLGEALETQPCTRPLCLPVAGIWSIWSEWSSCSGQCNQGRQQRTRTCFPQIIGTCAEKSWEIRDCTPSNCQECGIAVPSARVLGGHDSASCAWPWMVNMRLSTTQGPPSHLTLCSGVLLDHNSILTTAVCVNYLEYLKPVGISATVVVGERLSQEVDPYEVQSTISVTVIHPNYTAIGLEQFSNSDPNPFAANNLAVIQLAGNVTISSCRLPICLPDSGHLIAGQRCVVAGWGRVSREANMTAPTLQEASVTLLPTDQCERRLTGVGKTLPPGGISSHFLCTDSLADGVGTCEGDEGGVLMCPSTSGRWMVMGLVNDYRCQLDRPIVYPSVASDLQWIRDVMGQNQ